MLNTPANDSDIQGDGLLSFPCLFPVKAIGYDVDDFDALVVTIIRRHSATLAEGAVSLRRSGGGRYLAVTVRMQAESRAQLDAIYRELTAHPRVLMAL